MTTATNNLPATKTSRAALALELLRHATKTDRRTWNKTRLLKLTPEALAEKILTWGARAKKGRVTHISALAGTSIACAADKGKDLTLAQLFTTPVEVEGNKATCQGCRDACGLLTAAEQAEFLRREDEQIAAERASMDAAPTRAKARATTKKPRGTKINEARFAKHSHLGRVTLTGTYQGNTYQAELSLDGTVEYNETTYPSLSRAACAARETPTCNGWRFWTLADGNRADWLRGTEAKG